MKLGKDDYQAEGEQCRVLPAVPDVSYQAHVYAGIYGIGWLQVGAEDYVTLIGRKDGIITLEDAE